MIRILFRAVLLLALAAPLSAASHVWSGSSSNHFSDNANWIGGSPAGDAAADVTFPSGAGQTTLDNDLPSLTVHSLSFTGGVYTISGNAITVTSSILAGPPGGATISCDLEIPNNVTFTGGSSLILSGSIHGAGGVTATGVTFSGSTPNTYSGETVAPNGLRLAKSAGVVAVPGALTVPRVNSYSTGVWFDASEQLAPTTVLTLVGWVQTKPGTVTTLNHLVVAPKQYSGGGIDGTGKIILAGDVQTVDVYQGTFEAVSEVYLPATRTFDAQHLSLLFDNVTGAPGAGIIVKSGSINVLGTYTGPSSASGPLSALYVNDLASDVTLTAGAAGGWVAKSLVAQGSTAVISKVTGDVTLDAASSYSQHATALTDPWYSEFPYISPEVGGIVTLGGAQLRFDTSQHSPGSTYRILDNVGSHPINGTFAGIAEGGVTADGLFRITYSGGDGNDIVATDISRYQTTIEMGLSPYPTFGAPSTFTATVKRSTSTTATPPPIAGTFTVKDNGVAIGSAAVTNGTGSLSLTLGGGNHSITLAYSGDASYEPSTSTSPVTVQYPAPAPVSITPNPVVGGSAVIFQVTGDNFYPTLTAATIWPLPGTVHYISKTQATLEIDLTNVTTEMYESVIFTNAPGPAASTMTIHVTPPGNPTPGSAFNVTLGSTSITASTLPAGATLAWLFGSGNIYRTNSVMTQAAVIPDGNNDGAITWDFGTQLPSAQDSSTRDFAIAVDVASGAVGFGGHSSFGFPDRLTPPAGLFQLGPNGLVSRMVVGSPYGGHVGVLWIRPGTGVWTVDYPNPTWYETKYVSNILTTDFKPVGASPAAPASFAAGDTVAVLDPLNMAWFASRVDAYLTPTAGQGTILFRLPISSGVTEGGKVRVSFYRTGGSGGTLSVSYTLQPGGDAVPGRDYVATPGTLTFAPGEYLKYVDVQTLDDATYDGGRSIAFAFTPEALVTVADGPIGMTENDPPPVIRLAGNDLSLVEGNDPAAVVNIPLQLSGAASVPTAVNYQIFNGYSWSYPQKVTFAAGQTTATIAVNIGANTRPEPDRVLQVMLSNGLGYNLDPSPNVRKIAVTDDDLPNLAIAADQSILEGNSGTTVVRVYVKLDAYAVKPVMLNWTTVDGTARGGVDYVASSGTLTFTNETEKAIEIAIPGDTTPEPSRSFAVSLSNVTNANVTRSISSVTILDDDGTLPAMTVGNVTTTEGKSGDSVRILVPVTLSGASGTLITAHYATLDGTATGGVDYGRQTGTVYFYPGETQRFITVGIAGDDVAEADETFFITLDTPVGAAIGSAGLVTILDDDAHATVSISSVEIPEGNSNGAFAKLVATLSAPQTAPVTVKWATKDGSAKAGTDYVAASGILSFAPGETQQTILVGIVGDAVVENSETFTVELSDIAGVVAGNTVGTVVIDDDDSARPSLRVEDTAVMEGSVGTTSMTFTVTLSHAATATVTVDYATSDGSATASQDYIAATGTLTFAPGETTKTITLDVTGDSQYENAEELFLTLSHATGADLARAAATGTIFNDDFRRRAAGR